MSLAMRMLEHHPANLQHADSLASCIHVCFDCAQAYTACADVCLSEPKGTEFLTCVAESGPRRYLRCDRASRFPAIEY